MCHIQEYKGRFWVLDTLSRKYVGDYPTHAEAERRKKQVEASQQPAKEKPEKARAK